ncbi:hypothetical protein PJW08_09210 [Tenacibaculum finnmarkense]|nr:hypothetical protein PJW08_09210 [Tenacibaculum finnmarkense]
MKKTVLLAIILISGFINANAQSRTNEKILEFKTKSTKLSSAIGWKKNEKTGKWIENKNVIDDQKVASYWISRISQNFKWLQFSTINQDGKDYYVFLYERLAGTYKYPSIRKNWEKEKRTYFFVITTEQYNEIKTKIDLKSGNNIKIISKMSGNISDRFKILGGEHLYNEDNLLAKITKAIKKPSYSENCFILNSQTTDGNDIVRFRLPESCYSIEKYMKTEYFEVKTVEFQTILSE